MSAKIIDLHAFNIDSAALLLGIPLDGKAEHASMRYTYKRMAEDVQVDATERLKKSELITSMTVEEVKFRYDLFKNYAASFFSLYPGYEASMEALSISIICGEYIIRANEPVCCDNSGDTAMKNDGFDDATLNCACTFWNESVDIEKTGNLSDDEPYCPESLFLAHVNALDYLRDVRMGIEELDDEKLIDVVKRELSLMRGFTQVTTEIGIELKKELDILETEILALIKPEKKVVPNGSRANRPVFQVFDGGKP